MKKISLIIPAALILVSTGCMTAGMKFDPELAKGIKRGDTLESVISRLGEPSTRSTSADGKVVLIYHYTESQVHGATFIPIAGAFLGGATAKTYINTYTFVDDRLTDISVTTAVSTTGPMGR